MNYLTLGLIAFLCLALGIQTVRFSDAKSSWATERAAWADAVITMTVESEQIADATRAEAETVSAEIQTEASEAVEVVRTVYRTVEVPTICEPPAEQTAAAYEEGRKAVAAANKVIP